MLRESLSDGSLVQPHFPSFPGNLRITFPHPKLARALKGGHLYESQTSTRNPTGIAGNAFPGRRRLCTRAGDACPSHAGTGNAPAIAGARNASSNSANHASGDASPDRTRDTDNTGDTNHTDRTYDTHGTHNAGRRGRPGKFSDTRQHDSEKDPQAPQTFQDRRPAEPDDA